MTLLFPVCYDAGDILMEFELVLFWDERLSGFDDKDGIVGLDVGVCQRNDCYW